MTKIQMRKIHSDWLNPHIRVDGTPLLTKNYFFFNLYIVNYLHFWHKIILVFTLLLNLLLKVIFSLQNSNLMYSVEFSPVLVQIQVRMDVPIQVWNVMEVMRRDCKEHHMTQVHMKENLLKEMQMMEKVSEHVGMNYPEIPDSRFVASLWEEAGSAENPITIDKYEGFSETMTPQNTPPQQQPAVEPRPAVHSIENPQNSSAA